MSKRLTKEEFIEKAKKVHGDKYDYSKVEYVNNHTKVCIICSEHGEFWQKPSKHFIGQGCPKCANNIKITKEEYIVRANKVHNNFYTYNIVELKNMHDMIEIVCPIHGVFTQDAENHINGQNCPHCKGVKETTSKQQNGYKNYLEKNSEIFFEKVENKFNKKYSYEKSIYKGRDKYIIVTCPQHGDFSIKPFQHMRGHGCKECAKENRRKTLDSFIKEATETHHGFYRYDKTIINGVHADVIITCPIHGDFRQIPSAHLKGQGCPCCHASKLEKEIKEYLDCNKITSESQKKFKWSGKQTLDFYLPQYNVGIECQGIQHFKPIDFAGKGKEWANEMYKGILERDERKRKLCEENGIKLLYYSNLGIEYPYKVYENKELLLKDILT